MSNPNSMQQLAHKFINDAEFREQMRHDPQGAVESSGLPLDEEDRQALRSMDWSGSDEALKDVTHRHFDHAGGLAPLLTYLAALPQASLTVHATSATLQALEELLNLSIPGVEDWLGERLCWAELEHAKPTTAEDTQVTPFEVDHGLECVGFRVEQGGSAMAYAADTRPCPNVVEHARNANLLVHEAYGPEDDAKWAHAFGHSTAAEAGRIARDSGAKRLVLTHFRASRFTDPAALVKEAATIFGRPVEAAGDLDAFDF